uniref:Uncharacterized protein n=1 Tax=Mycena chlorophos TaxID=658473 RepID=A0ABQ0KW15_MYCCL|nr:predicted protein [Mycena chlorophos]
MLGAPSRPSALSQSWRQNEGSGIDLAVRSLLDSTRVRNPYPSLAKPARLHRGFAGPGDVAAAAFVDADKYEDPPQPVRDVLRSLDAGLEQGRLLIACMLRGISLDGMPCRFATAFTPEHIHPRRWRTAMFACGPMEDFSSTVVAKLSEAVPDPQYPLQWCPVSLLVIPPRPTLVSTDRSSSSRHHELALRLLANGRRRHPSNPNTHLPHSS